MGIQRRTVTRRMADDRGRGKALAETQPSSSRVNPGL